MPKVSNRSKYSEAQLENLSSLLTGRIFCIGLKRDLHPGTRLEAHLLTLFIGQCVVNAYLSIKMSDRAKRPALVQPSAPNSELNPGDRVEGLANFGKPTGEFGTVEQTNEDDALVKWDDDGRMRLRQPWLKKVSKKIHPFGKPANA